MKLTGDASLSCLPFHCGERAIDRGGAHREQSRAHLRSELQMPGALHGLNEDRNQRPQALAADPVRCLP